MTDEAVRWVVFDYGEVISRRTAELPTLAELIGADDPDTFAAAYWSEREAYDRGQSDAGYWANVARRVGVGVTAELVGKLTEVDGRGWLETVPESVALVEELHAAGVPTGILSNAPASFGRVLERQAWVQRVEHLLFSADLRCAKPDAAIWAELIGRLGARPAEMLFFDDKPTNVVAAREAGLRAEVWSDAATGRVALVELGVLG